MKASGLFFLRMHAGVFCDTSGARVEVRMPVVERDPADYRVILNELVIRWRGAEAIAFFDAHQAELRAGRPLNIELDRLAGRDGEWQAFATSVQFAPLAPSWLPKLAPPEPQPQAT